MNIKEERKKILRVVGCFSLFLFIEFFNLEL